MDAQVLVELGPLGGRGGTAHASGLLGGGVGVGVCVQGHNVMISSGFTCPSLEA